MVQILVEVEVEDFERFWEGFQTRGLPLRKEHGSRGVQVLRHADQPQRVVLLFDWESPQHWERFMADPRVRESQRRGGAISVKATFLQQAGQLQA